MENPHRTAKWPRPGLAIGLCAAGLALAAVALGVRALGSKPHEKVAAPPEIVPQPSRARAWRPLPAGSALVAFTDAAFVGSELLATDGRRAMLATPELGVRPIDVPVPIARVFAGAGRLFAQGESAGAPFLVALLGAEPLVVPMPCPLAALAGEGERLVGACAGGGALAESSDGGRSFRKLSLPVPPASAPALGAVAADIEAVAVDSGAAAAVVVQRWESAGDGERLQWSFSQVGLRARGEGTYRFAPVPGLARSLAVRLAGGAVTVAGVELSAEGALDEAAVAPRLRFFRGPAGQSPSPAGSPGPACSAAPGESEGVLLDPQIGVFRCGAKVVLTLDGGARWLAQEGLGHALALRGGDMRLALRTEEGVFELGFPLRQPSGAVAQRAPGSAARSRETGPIAPAVGIAEPSLDGGTSEAARW